MAKFLKKGMPPHDPVLCQLLVSGIFIQQALVGSSGTQLRLVFSLTAATCWPLNPKSWALFSFKTWTQLDPHRDTAMGCDFCPGCCNQTPAVRTQFSLVEVTGPGSHDAFTGEGHFLWKSILGL